MANPTSGESIRRIGSSIVQERPTELPSLADIAEKRSQDDYVSRLEELTGARRERDDAPVIAVAALTPILPQGPGEADLREAKRLIEQQEHAGALGHLDSALAAIRAAHAATPNHHEPALHEALYMQALCLTRLDRDQDALRALAGLGENVPAGTLGARTGALRTEIRERILADVMSEHGAAISSGESAAAIRRLRVLCELDPGMTMFHYLLAGSLMVADQLDDAASAAAEGLRRARRRPEAAPNGLRVLPGGGGLGQPAGSEASSDDVRSLERLRDQIERRRLLRALEPARKLYRKGKFGRARSKLGELRAEFGTDPLWQVFDGYTAALDASRPRFGRGGQPAPAPRGTPWDLDSLHFLLVGDDIARGKARMGEGGWAAALVEIDVALQHAPYFPYAHFLKARCEYSDVLDRLATSPGLALDEAIARLDRARKHATHAMEDPELCESNVPHVIDDALATLRGIEEEQRRNAADARLLNPLIDQYMSTMSAAETTGSPTALREAGERMQRLSDRVAGLVGRLQTEEGCSAAAELEVAVANRCREFDELRPGLEEAELVLALQAKLNSILASVAGGVSRPAMPKLRRRLSSLGEEVDAARLEIDGEAATGALDQLAGAVLMHIQQVDKLMRS